MKGLIALIGTLALAASPVALAQNKKDTVTNPAAANAKKGQAATKSQKASGGQGNPGQAGGGQWDKGAMKSGTQKASGGQGNPGQAGGGQWDKSGMKAGVKGEAAAKQKAAIK